MSEQNSLEANKALVHRWFEEVWNRGPLTVHQMHGLRVTQVETHPPALAARAPTFRFVQTGWVARLCI